MFGATLMDIPPAEREPDFLTPPWPEGRDEWVSPLAREDEDEEVSTQ